jgi:hypothetical protein
MQHKYLNKAQRMQNHQENEALVKERENRVIAEKNEVRGDIRTEFNHLGTGYDAQRQYLEKSQAHQRLHEQQYLTNA